MSSRMDVQVSRWYERLSLFRALSTILVVAIVLVALSGLLVRIVEPETFDNLGLAYWWSVETVSTVGYGDVVPTTPAGRIVASMLMLTGLALIPTLTSVIVSVLLAKQRRSEQERIEQLEIEQAAVLARIEERLLRIERQQ